MGFNYGYDFGFGSDFASIDPEIGSVPGVVLVIYLVVVLLMLAFSIACYVLQSVGLYSIAKRRGIRHPWLSWLPLGNMWILGSISDQYQYVAKGQIRNRRKVLLGLMIAIYVLGLPVEILALAVAAMDAGINAALVLLGIALATCVICIVATVFQYIANYDLFASSDPNNATVFLILGIFFPVTLPFFIFACRKKDRGMPPRKQKLPESETSEAPGFPEAQQDDFEL